MNSEETLDPAELAVEVATDEVLVTDEVLTTDELVFDELVEVATLVDVDALVFTLLELEETPHT